MKNRMKCFFTAGNVFFIVGIGVVNAEELVITATTPPPPSSFYWYFPESSTNNNVVIVTGLNYPSRPSVSGGYASSGVFSSNNNSVSISNSFLDNVFGGGYSNNGASGNVVYVDGSIMDSVYGGISSAPTPASNNKVTLNNTSTTTRAVGGNSDELTRGGTANNNVLIINGGSHSLVQAGISGGETKNNTLILNNMTSNYAVMPGLAYFLGSVTGNTLIATNSKLALVHGGQLRNPEPGAYTTYNTVEFRGETSASSDVLGGAIFGNTDNYNYDVFTGNKLIVAPTTQSIVVGGGVYNFSILEFDYSDFSSGVTASNVTNAPPALLVGTEARLKPGGNISNISISGIGGSSGRVNLIQMGANGDPMDFGGALATDIPGLESYDFLTINPGLENNNKTLYAVFGMNWFFANADAHGIFTLEGDDEFSVGVVLDDQPANNSNSNPNPIYNNWNGTTLTKRGTGTLILEEANTYTGLTTIEAGTLQLGDGGNEGSIATISNILNNGVLAVNRNDDFTLANAISGAGAVTYAGTSILRLSNTANSYSGGTNVNSGTLAITVLDALGTGVVNNSAAVLFDNAQGNFANTISGTGDVSFSNGSDVRLLAGLTASDITIDAGSSATIASTNPFAGVITNNGVLAVDVASNYVLDGPISGAGMLNQQGTGQLLLTQANSYSGGTNINAGTLAINNTGAVGSGAVNNAGTFAFTGASGAFANPISGAGNVRFADNSNIDITGALTASMTTVDAGSRASVAAGQQWNSAVTNAGTLDLGENSTLNGAVTNSGQLSMEGSAVQASVIGNVINAGQIRLDDDNSVGSLLTINGDYVGNNGVLVINTQVGDDNSPTDLLKISGAASGQSELLLRNIGGQGDEALRGIRIIETGSSTRDAFALRGGHVAAGAYDYTLLRRSETDGDNWYLHNGFDIDGDGEPDPEAGPTYTPGLGSVIANTIAANALFNMRFEDREGAGQSQLGAKTQDNLWVRYSGGNNKFHALNNQLHTSGHSSAMQIGVGLPSLLESHSIDLGVMAGYGHYKGNTKSSRTERKSSSVVDGYSVGLYGTWYSDPASQSGVYIDSWLLWNHFNNRITGADDNKYRYKSKGVTASVEVGKGFAIGEIHGADIWMQPQAQVIYQGVRANKVTDAQDVTAKRGSANVQLRAGVKTYADDIMLGNMSSRPFVEINYIHNTDHYSVKIDDSTYRAAGGKNIGEIRLGLEGNVLGSHQMWINTGYADGGKHYQDFSIQAGWKYQF